MLRDQCPSFSGLIAKGGAYETGPGFFDRFALPFKVPPASVMTFWARTEDRKGQLVPPGIQLETPYTSMNDGARAMHAARILFLLLAIMAGCLLFICIYTVYQYYLSRDTATGWYILYAISCFLMSLFWMDIRHQLGIFNPVIRDIIYSSFLFLIPVLYSLLISRVLNFGTHFKKAWLLVKILIAISMLQMGGVFIFPEGNTAYRIS